MENGKNTAATVVVLLVALVLASWYFYGAFAELGALRLVSSRPRGRGIVTMLGKPGVPTTRLVRLYVKLRGEYDTAQQQDVLLARSEVIRLAIAMAVLSAGLSGMHDIKEMERSVRVRVGNKVRKC